MGMTLDQAYAFGQRVEITRTDGTVERGIVRKNHPSARVRIFVLCKRRDSLGGYPISQSEIASITEVEKAHAPKDVYETREDYRCGICHKPVNREYPRRWHHEEAK